MILQNFFLSWSEIILAFLLFTGMLIVLAFLANVQCRKRVNGTHSWQVGFYRPRSHSNLAHINGTFRTTPENAIPITTCTAQLETFNSSPGVVDSPTANDPPSYQAFPNNPPPYTSHYGYPLTTSAYNL